MVLNCPAGQRTHCRAEAHGGAAHCTSVALAYFPGVQADVGEAVGTAVGCAVGAAEGAAEGAAVGVAVGAGVGSGVGAGVGAVVGGQGREAQARCWNSCREGLVS
jgi:hypothetical protein